MYPPRKQVLVDSKNAEGLVFVILLVSKGRSCLVCGADTHRYWLFGVKDPVMDVDGCCFGPVAPAPDVVIHFVGLDGAIDCHDVVVLQIGRWVDDMMAWSLLPSFFRIRATAPGSSLVAVRLRCNQHRLPTSSEHCTSASRYVVNALRSMRPLLRPWQHVVSQCERFPHVSARGRFRVPEVEIMMRYSPFHLAS